MIGTASRYWWIAATRGIISVILGILAFMYPGIALATLVLWFGVWALLTGAFGFFEFFIDRKQDHRIIQLIGSLLSIAVGVMTFISPNVTALVLVIYIAAWAFVQGIFEIVTAIRIYSLVSGAWMLLVSGIASVLFSLLVLWNPLPGAIALLWLIAAYAIVFGILSIGFGFRLRRSARA